MNIPLHQIILPTIDLRATIDWEALEELADSMRDNGQLQSIGVRPIPRHENDDLTDIFDPQNPTPYINNGGMFEVVFGARRFRAATMNEWDSIRADIVTMHDERTTASHKLIENVQRESLTPIEEGYALLGIIGDDEPNIRNLMRQTGKSRDWIRRRLELVVMPDDLQQAVQSGIVSMAVATEFAKVEHEETRQRYIEHAATNSINADDARYMASNWEAAASGVTSMQDFEQMTEERKAKLPYVPQMWLCFVCREPRQQTECSMHNICRECQPTITRGRTLGE